MDENVDDLDLARVRRVRGLVFPDPNVMDTDRERRRAVMMEAAERMGATIARLRAAEDDVDVADVHRFR